MWSSHASSILTALRQFQGGEEGEVLPLRLAHLFRPIAGRCTPSTNHLMSFASVLDAFPFSLPAAFQASPALPRVTIQCSDTPWRLPVMPMPFRALRAPSLTSCAVPCTPCPCSQHGSPMPTFTHLSYSVSMKRKKYSWTERLGLLCFRSITPAARPRTRRAAFTAPGANVCLLPYWQYGSWAG